MKLYISVLTVRESRNCNNTCFKFARYVVTYSDTALAQISDIRGKFTAKLQPTITIYLILIFCVPNFVIII